MEALAGVSLAANVIQFIDFSYTLVSRGKRIHRNGSPSEHGDLEKVTIALVDYNRRLQESLASRMSSADGPTEDEKVWLHEFEHVTTNDRDRLLSPSQQSAHESPSSCFNDSSN